MATVCDACGEKFARNGGHAALHVSPPIPDFKIFNAFATAGQPYEHRDPVDLDLCLACASKALTHLGLPTDVCELPEAPAVPTSSGDNDQSPLAGALTEEELRALIESSEVQPKI